MLKLTFKDSVFIIDNLSQRSQTVGGAGCIGNNLQARIILLMVYSHNKHGSISRGSRYNNLLCSSLGVGKSFINGGEYSSRLNYILSSSTSPVNVDRVALIKDGDLVSVYVKEGSVLLHLSFKLSVGGIILEHVNHVVQGDEGIVDRNNLEN